jgi:hypothetical protein
MNRQALNFLDTARKIAGKIGFGPKSVYSRYKYIDYTGDEASTLIREKLLAPEPAMIARFGTSELFAVLNAISLQRKGAGKYFRYVTGSHPFLRWDPKVMQGIFVNAGFFPADTKLLDRYAELMIDCMHQTDILGSWIDEEAFSRKILPAP